MDKRKVKGLQIVVYDVGNNPVSSKVQEALEEAVQGVLQEHTTLAHTVVTADWQKPPRKPAKGRIIGLR